MSLLAAVAVLMFAAAGWVRDGALEWGATHPTRFVALTLLVIGAALAVQRPEAALVAAAFAPGIWWAPRHGDSIRFGEGGTFYLDQLGWALANAAILLALPALALWWIGENPIPLLALGILSRPAAYWVGWWMAGKGWLEVRDPFPPTRFGHTVWFAGIGAGLALA